MVDPTIDPSIPDEFPVIKISCSNFSRNLDDQ